MDKQKKIEAFKFMLERTDYQALKHADGAISDEEYAPIREKRAEWRRMINELEALPGDGDEA